MLPTEERTEQKKRTHHRSPSYPMLNLKEAVEKAALIYGGDKRSLTSRAVILKHLGYEDESNGTGNRELSALKQYGLIEEQGRQFRISDRAYAILFLSDSSDEKRTKLSDAALAPTIFRDIWAKYGSDASDETLKDYLIQSKDFNPASVIEVVRNYRTTIDFAKPVAITDAGGDENDSGQEQGETGTEQQPPLPPRVPTSSGVQKPPAPPAAKPGVPETERVISTPVGKDEGRVVFAHVRFDAGIKREFVSSLKKYLDYLETTLQ